MMVTKQEFMVFHKAAAGMLMLAVVLAGSLAGCGSNTQAPQQVEPVAPILIPPPQVGQLRWTNDPTLAFSEDGRRLAYVVFEEGDNRQILLWDMAAREAHSVAGAEGGDTPFFSPDGEWLGFFADGSLKKVLLPGGESITLTPKAPNLRGASWGPNGNIVFNLTSTDTLYEVSADGGEPRQLTTLGEGELSHRWAHVLPGGHAVLFTIAVSENPDESLIAVLSLDTGEKKILVRGGTFARYATTGHLVYHRRDAILAVGFDPETLEVRGSTLRVTEAVLGSPPDTLTGVAQFAFSNTGAMSRVVPTGQTEGDRKVYQIEVWPEWFADLRGARALGN